MSKSHKNSQKDETTSSSMEAPKTTRITPRIFQARRKEIVNYTSFNMKFTKEEREMLEKLTVSFGSMGRKMAGAEVVRRLISDKYKEIYGGE